MQNLAYELVPAAARSLDYERGAVGTGQRTPGAGPRCRQTGGRGEERGAGRVGAGQLIASGMPARWQWPFSRQRSSAPARITMRYPATTDQFTALLPRTVAIKSTTRARYGR